MAGQCVFGAEQNLRPCTPGADWFSGGCGGAAAGFLDCPLGDCVDSRAVCGPDPADGGDLGAGIGL